MIGGIISEGNGFDGTSSFRKIVQGKWFDIKSLSVMLERFAGEGLDSRGWRGSRLDALCPLRRWILKFS